MFYFCKILSYFYAIWNGMFYFNKTLKCILSHITAGWRQTYHSENLEKTIPTKVSAVLDTYGYAKLAGTKKFGCLPSCLAARGVFVPSKSRLSKSAIFYPKKWFFGNSDTTFTLTKFFRLHFVQMS